MRILIPILLLAGLGVGYLAFRRNAEPTSTGIGPDKRAAVATAPAAPLRLESGTPGGARTAADSAAASPELPSPGATVPAPAVSDPEPTKEPTFVDGVTTDPLGTKIPLAGKEFYIEKYRDATRATRVVAYDSLRAAVDIELAGASKNSAALAAEMKREMEWLQENFDPETP